MNCEPPASLGSGIQASASSSVSYDSWKNYLKLHFKQFNHNKCIASLRTGKIHLYGNYSNEIMRLSVLCNILLMYLDHRSVRYMICEASMLYLLKSVTKMLVKDDL